MNSRQVSQNQEGEQPNEDEAAGVATSDGLGEILRWSLTCPEWQRDALRRLCMGAELNENDESELLEILKVARPGQPISADHIRQRTNTSQTIRLKAISDVDNVNALATGQKLSFGDQGLTAIYGDNGSGKSGYVRILKAACRARRENGFDIRPNIFGDSMQPPQAQIAFWDNATKRQAKWQKGIAPPAVLSAVSVFDSSAGNIHVNGTNDIAYTPLALAILARLARVADKLRAALTAEISQLETQIPPSLASHGCSPHSKTGQLLGTLGEKTKPESVNALSNLSAEEKSELDSLRRDLADDPATIAKRSAALSSRLTALREQMDKISAALGDDTVQRIITTRAEVATATELYIVDAARRFTDEPLPVGSAEWKEMWQAASHYAESAVHPGSAFPQTGEGTYCVLCQRPHDPVSADRFDRFNRFVADEIGKKIKAGEEALVVALSFDGSDFLKAQKIREIREHLVGAGEQQLAEAISEFLIRSAWRHRWLRRCAGNASVDDAPGLTAVPSEQVNVVVGSLQQRAHILQGAATSPERQTLKERFDELSDRTWLSVVREDVLKAISVRRQIATLKALSAQTQRAKITAKSTALAKLLVTDRLRDRFADEVSKLNISRLRVELRQEGSAVGEPKFKICFIAKPSERVGAVLSEGELRCLSIAAFLAELETAENHSAIVLDDPICSLDHGHREAVARRLAEEAMRRQVIVFTHDVPFLSQLQRAAKDIGAQLLMRLVSRGAVPGFCHDDAPPTHRAIEDAVAGIGRDLQNKRYLFDTGSPAWADEVTRFGGVVRKLWERAVEEAVSPVLTRWSANIDTKGFIRLTALTKIDHETMRAAYGLCSVWEHYQPAAGNIPQPTADQIAEEIAKLATWIANVRTRQEAVR